MGDVLQELVTWLHQVFIKQFDAWILLGFIAQFFFTMCFVVQWLASEKAKRSVVPVGSCHGSPRVQFNRDSAPGEGADGQPRREEIQRGGRSHMGLKVERHRQPGQRRVMSPGDQRRSPARQGLGDREGGGEVGSRVAVELPAVPRVKIRRQPR